jgi:microsomal dipeptidase-like Zn-dependent dipeptidase
MNAMQISERTRWLPDQAIVFDCHNQIMIEASLRKDRRQQNVMTNHYAPLIRQGGVNVLDMVVGADDHSLGNLNDDPTYAAFSLIDMLLEEEATSDTFTICRSAADIDRAVADGKIAMLTKLEGGRPIDGMYVGVPKTKIVMQGSKSVEEYPFLTDALVKHGYSDEDVVKTLGGNLLRLHKRVLG